MSLLESLGLDDICEVVYRSTLSAPNIDAVELAEALGLPYSQIQAALARLSGLGLVRPSQDHTGRYRPVRPEVGLAALLHQQEEEMASRTAAVATARRAVSEFIAGASLLGDGLRSTRFRQLSGKDAVQARMEVLARRHGVEFLSVVPGGPVPAAELSESRPLDAKVLGSGAAYRLIYQYSIRRDPATMAYTKWLASQGAQVRTGTVLPARMVIVDRSIAFVPHGDSGHCTLEVTADGIVALLLSLFEEMWRHATGIGAEPPRERQTGLTEADRQLLNLLASGLTDEAAAKRLGMSVRTVRRTMARLMRELNATSRFEAGLKAHRDWLLGSVQGSLRTDADLTPQNR